MPEVSAILVNYNAGGELALALRSIRSDCAQIPWEAVVVDNASSDGSAAVVETLPARDAHSQRRERWIRPGRQSGCRAREGTAAAAHQSGLPIDFRSGVRRYGPCSTQSRPVPSSDRGSSIRTAGCRAVREATRTC